MKLLATGSSGLIGSEVVRHFDALGWDVHGVDNNMRADFFGPQGDTRWNQRRLESACRRFTHHELDIRDRAGVLRLVEELRPDADRSRRGPAEPRPGGFAALRRLRHQRRRHAEPAWKPRGAASPEAPFVHMSTNKVYGDAPNELPLAELDTRWDYARGEDYGGIREDFRIDRSKHSIFGASKVAADVMAQEYGRYFGMKTCCLRGGCLTGPNHSGVELHGFLSYLVKVQRQRRRLQGVRLQGQAGPRQHPFARRRALHRAIHRAHPRCGEVYNLGGGRDNSCSILEAFEIVRGITGKPMRLRVRRQESRRRPHLLHLQPGQASRPLSRLGHYPRPGGDLRGNRGGMANAEFLKWEESST